MKKIILLGIGLMALGVIFGNYAYALVEFTSEQWGEFKLHGTLQNESLWKKADVEKKMDWGMCLTSAKLEFEYNYIKPFCLLGVPIDSFGAYVIYRGGYDAVYDISNKYGNKANLFVEHHTERHVQRENEVREYYVDVAMGKLALRVGRQQVVWGKTDFFRLADVINPLDYSKHYFFEDWPDIRIPLKIVKGVYSLPDFLSLAQQSFEFVLIIDDFAPIGFGIYGQPWAIVGPGFHETPKSYPDGQVNYGFRYEGLLGGVTFALNFLHHNSDAPIYHFQRGHLIYPGQNIFGGSVDYYHNPSKFIFRGELTFTPNKSMQVDMAFPQSLPLYLENQNGIYRTDELKYCVGFDRPTWIRFLNNSSTFFLSGQCFIWHVLNYRHVVDDDGSPAKPTNIVVTLLAATTYLNGRLNPQAFWAFNVQGDSHIAGAYLEYLLGQHWSVKVGTNQMFGHYGAFQNFGSIWWRDEIYTYIKFKF